MSVECSNNSPSRPPRGNSALLIWVLPLPRCVASLPISISLQGAFADETVTSPRDSGGLTALQRTINNPRLYDILLEHRLTGGSGNSPRLPATETGGVAVGGGADVIQPMASEKDRQASECDGLAGLGEPNVRLPFFYTKFIKGYVLLYTTYPDYLAYLWQFARDLMQDRAVIPVRNCTHPFLVPFDLLEAFNDR